MSVFYRGLRRQYLFLNVDEHAGLLRQPILIAEFRIRRVTKMKCLELTGVVPAGAVEVVAVELQVGGCGPKTQEIFLVRVAF
jgi:hypothetical protein